MTAPPTLDDLVRRARAATVAPDVAAAYVAELGRRVAAVPPRPARPWRAWLAGGAFGAALAAAAAIVIIVARPGSGTAPAGAGAPVQVGDRVAIATAPGTAYRIAVADVGRTEIVVDRGELTARLYPGSAAHRLVLRGGGVEAMATGTVYTLAVDAGTARVSVHEGTVAVRDAGGVRAVERGASWPAGAATGTAAANQLLALAPAEPTRDLARGPDPASGSDPARSPASPDSSDLRGADATPAEPPATAAARRAGPSTAGGTDAADAASAAALLRDRWRTCRLLRTRGELAAAVRECVAIADAGDATWSPIALVEAIRIELEPAASPERAVELADRMERTWPAHQLAAEARELRCRALRQLGRDAECTQADAAP
jgi:hypothetical protein